MTQPKRGTVRLSVDDWTLLYQPYEAGDQTPNKALVEYLWTEMNDGSIQNGIHRVNSVRYLVSRLPYPLDVDIYVEDTYDVDFCIKDEQGGLDVISSRNEDPINLPQILEDAQLLADGYQKTVVIVFVNGERENMEVEPNES